jgi:hypothetical protein
MPSQKLNWNSDWDGHEIGHDDREVVGLYSVKGMDIDLFIDMETMQILEFFCSKDHEEE